MPFCYFGWPAEECQVKMEWHTHTENFAREILNCRRTSRHRVDDDVEKHARSTRKLHEWLNTHTHTQKMGRERGERRTSKKNHVYNNNFVFNFHSLREHILFIHLLATHTPLLHRTHIQTPLSNIF